MRVYKHMPSQFAPAFVAGQSIAIGTFAYYRDREDSGDGRTDRLEGRLIARQTRATNILKGCATSHQRDAAKMFGLDIGDGGYGPFSGNVAVHDVPAAYLFCCSREPNVDRIPLGETIFEISDLAKFAKRVRCANSTILGRASIGEVKYVEHVGDPFLDSSLAPSLFAKYPQFAFEQEIRAIWPIAGRASS